MLLLLELTFSHTNIFCTSLFTFKLDLWGTIECDKNCYYEETMQNMISYIDIVDIILKQNVIE